jgi:ketosteroid isomerase-like protein
MGNGRAPSGVDLDTLGPIDDGTLPRSETPPPGPIGLDAKGGSAKQTGPSIAERVLGYASRNRDHRVGTGECFALADGALRAAGARSAADYDTITPDADYTWGTPVALADLQPGDVIQFRDYVYDLHDVTEDSRGKTIDDVNEDRPHHTAIVHTVDGNGAVTVWEQNAPLRSGVHLHQLFFTSGTTTSGHRTRTITVRGTVWFFRPQARE